MEGGRTPGASCGGCGRDVSSCVREASTLRHRVLCPRECFPHLACISGMGHAIARIVPTTSPSAPIRGTLPAPARSMPAEGAFAMDEEHSTRHANVQLPYVKSLCAATVSNGTQRQEEQRADSTHPRSRSVSPETHPPVTSTLTTLYTIRSGRPLGSLRSAAPPKPDPPYCRRGTQPRNLMQPLSLRYFQARPFAPEIEAPEGCGSVSNPRATRLRKASGTVCATRTRAFHLSGHLPEARSSVACILPPVGHNARPCNVFPRCVLARQTLETLDFCSGVLPHAFEAPKR